MHSNVTSVVRWSMSLAIRFTVIRAALTNLVTTRSSAKPITATLSCPPPSPEEWLPHFFVQWYLVTDKCQIIDTYPLRNNRLAIYTQRKLSIQSSENVALPRLMMYVTRVAVMAPGWRHAPTNVLMLTIVTLGMRLSCSSAKWMTIIPMFRDDGIVTNTIRSMIPTTLATMFSLGRSEVRAQLNLKNIELNPENTFRVSAVRQCRLLSGERQIG